MQQRHENPRYLQVSCWMFGAQDLNLEHSIESASQECKEQRPGSAQDLLVLREHVVNLSLPAPKMSAS